MTEIDYLKLKLEDKEKAFDRLHKLHMELLKKQGELEKENKQLKEQLQNIKELIDNTIRRNEKAIEWGKNMGADVGAISFHNEMLKQMNGDVE